MTKNETQPMIFVIDGSVLRKYLKGEDDTLSKIFEKVDRMPTELVQLFTAKSIIEKIKAEGNYPDAKMKEIEKRIVIVDVAKLVSGTDLEAAFRATEEMDKK